MRAIDIYLDLQEKSGLDILKGASIDDLIQGALAAHEFDKCTNCGVPVTQGYHLADMLVKSCRAASFKPEYGWDEGIPKHWKATI